MKANVLAVSLVLAFSGMTFAGNEHGIDPSLAPPPMIPPPMPVGLFGPGWQGAAHALYLMPGEDTSDNVFGGGLNLDCFVDRNVAFQASGSWADPGTDDLWHNYTVDVIFRAPMQNFAPYVFAGGGVIVEDTTDLLGRAGLGLEFRPTTDLRPALFVA